MRRHPNVPGRPPLLTALFLLASGMLPAGSLAEVASPVLYRINAGGLVLNSLDSDQDWAEDSQTNPSPFSNYANTSTVIRSTWMSPTTAVPDYIPRDMFRSERYGPMQWNFPLSAGLHVEVRLFFAETFEGITGAGQRVFNVRIENQLVLDHFDIYAEYGKYVGLMKTFPATVGPDGNLDIDFQPVVENPLIDGIEIRANCRVSTAQWQNASFSVQTGRFSVEYDATPLGSNIDAVTTLSAGPGTTYTDFAVLVGFNNAGKIQARDGSVYRADANIKYTAGTIYHFRLVISVAEHRYDAYVTPFGGAELTVGTHLAFRTEQSGVSSLANWAISPSAGTQEVCSFTVYPHVHNMTANTWHARIQTAVDAANSGDVLVLSPGIYTSAGNRDVTCGDKSLTIQSVNPLDPAVVERTVIDCQASPTDRHRAFKMQSDQSPTINLAGLTITNGCAPIETIEGQEVPAGGAVFCTGVALSLDYCVLRDNSARSPSTITGTMNAYGGAVYCTGPAIYVTNCTVTRNLTFPSLFFTSNGDSFGGGLFLICPQAISIRNSHISGNTAYGAQQMGVGNGGGVYAEGPTIISDSTIDSNRAGGSEWYASGGGVYAAGPLTVTNCTVSANSAEGGNDVSGLGGGICCAASATIENCIIDGNGSWAIGGGVYCASTESTRVANCILRNNTGGGYDGRGGGGAVSGAGLIQNCLIMANSAYRHGSSLSRCGNVIGCTILGNWIEDYGAVVDSCGLVKNCLIWGNYSRYDPPIWSSELTYSCIDDPQQLGEGNIHSDPRLQVIELGSLTSPSVMDPPYSRATILTDASKSWEPGSLVGKMVNPDLGQTRQFYIFANTGTTLSVWGNASFAQAGASYQVYDYHLRPCSPLINAGDPTGDYTGQTDVDGRPRVSYGRVDIGAHEFDVPVDPLPGPPVDARPSPLYVCPGECSRLSATLCGAGETLEWLAADGSILPGGATPTVCPESTTTYYARARAVDSGLVGIATPVTLRVRTPNNWHPLGYGLDAAAFTLGSFRGDLIAGGYFSQSGQTVLNGIARWDGSVWQPLGQGVIYSVGTLQAYGDELIVGGTFDQAGGLPAANIARWNGSAWNTLGSGMDGPVTALAVYEDSLIAGGFFSIAGGTSAQNLARWTGTEWQPFGGGANDTVFCLLVYGGDLVAGGRFTTAGGTPANRIARWNGTSWQPLGQGMDDSVNALAVYNGELIATGFFLTADGKTVNHVARWNGSEWNALGSGTNQWVGAMAVYGGELIAGGAFTSAGEVNATYLAAWNGSAWRDLGSSPDSSVNALIVNHRELIVGGSFTSIGGVRANSIAGWGCCSQLCAADLDSDCDVDAADLAALVACGTGPGVDYAQAGLPPGCQLWPDGDGRIKADFDRDADVDADDFARIQRCFGDPARPPQPGCSE